MENKIANQINNLFDEESMKSVKLSIKESNKKNVKKVKISNFLTIINVKSYKKYLKGNCYISHIHTSATKKEDF